MDNSKFRKGETVYACVCCGRKTRNTGVQSVGSELCSECYELAGIENAISDGKSLSTYESVIKEYIADIRRKGGIAVDWVNRFGLKETE